MRRIFYIIPERDKAFLTEKCGFLDKLGRDIGSFYTALLRVLPQVTAGGAFKIHKIKDIYKLVYSLQ